MITKSTRLQNLIFSLIDQIFSNRHDVSNSAGVLVSDISDHFITFSILKSKNRTSTPKTFSYRDFSQNNINLFKNNLSNINWNSLYFLTVADDAFNSFWDLFNTVFELHFPWITKKFNKNIHKLQPFMFTCSQTN